MDWALARNRQQIQQLTATVEEPTWANFMAPLEQLEDDLDRIWAPVEHLVAVRDEKNLRAAYENCLPKLSDYHAERGQDRNVWQAIHRIRHDGHYDTLDPAQRMTVDQTLRDFHLQGVDLDVGDQQRYREISSELSRLDSQFSHHVMDATDAWYLDIVDESRLGGIPANARHMARQVAQSAGVDGWRFTLQDPSYEAIMVHAEDAWLREAMYRARVTRASEIGPHAGQWDNGPVMRDILRLRRELAQLLGYRHYAEYSLVTKMAEKPADILDFLQQLSDRCRPAGMKEQGELERFAREELDMEALKPWDYAWVSEKLLRHRHDFDEMTLRPYFPLSTVLEGMFWIVGQLFEIQVEQAEAPSVWHPDVQFFQIRDWEGASRGFFYADWFARPHKQGGAWMADCVTRRVTDHGVQIPVAFLNCNFSPPLEDQPCLLTHAEVRTLFHEFGHGLHHMLTTVEVAEVSGINGVPWDAVELPSQFLENWCWEPAALDRISGHVETGDPLPAELLDKMLSGRNFQSAMHMCRQLVYAFFDLRLHLEFDPSGQDSIQDLLDAVQSEVAVVEVPSYVRFPNAFGHIFAGGYAAGYYSYLWAEVLSSDAFSRFEENGILDRETGLSFLHWILEPGGSQEPMTLFEGFRGRPPTVDALLRHQGLGSLEEVA